MTLEAMQRVVVNSFGSDFTPDRARLILSLRAGPREEASLEELGQRANEGELAPEEAAEYDAHVRFGTSIAIVQARARNFLRDRGLEE